MLRLFIGVVVITKIGIDGVLMMTIIEPVELIKAIVDGLA
jgi:hypothetical protein